MCCRPKSLAASSCQKIFFSWILGLNHHWARPQPIVALLPHQCELSVMWVLIELLQESFRVLDIRIPQTYRLSDTIPALPFMTTKYEPDPSIWLHITSKKHASAGNRTRGSCMASRNFTTKPLMLRTLILDDQTHNELILTRLTHHSVLDLGDGARSKKSLSNKFSDQKILPPSRSSSSSNMK